MALLLHTDMYGAGDWRYLQQNNKLNGIETIYDATGCKTFAKMNYL